MARIIGGVSFAVITYLVIFTGWFEFLAVVFLIVGLYEAFQMWKLKQKIIIIIYLIIYILGLYSLIIINAFDSTLLALFVGIIMLNDTCAYFVGINFGKTKFSKVSPKKSVEGLFGGVIGSTLATLLIIGFFELFFPGFINIKVGVSAIIGFCIIIDVFAILGDLLESKLKRTIGIKDSGTIVYGHGGILDRLDSWVLAAIPVATYIMFF